MGQIRTLEQVEFQLNKELIGTDELARRIYTDEASNEYLILSSLVGHIEYVEPWAIRDKLIIDYRNNFGSNAWLKFLKSIEKGKFWARINKEQKEVLLKGELKRI